MSKIKSVYNFVPAPSKEDDIIIPEWSKEISQDMPISEDVISGTVTFNLRAASNFYTSEGVAIKESDAKESIHIIDKDNKKKYFIPGTTLKGCFRSVLEIMTFSRMHKVQDSQYALRDLNNSQEYMNEFKDINKVSTRCGWLYKDEAGDVYIDDCGTPARIRHDKIDKYLGTKFVDRFSKKGKNKLSDAEKSADYKYREVQKVNMLNKLSVNYDTEEKPNMLLGIINEDSHKIGTIVFTGQPGLVDYDSKPGKKYEFIFPNDNSKKIEISKKQIKQFLNLNNDSNLKLMNPAWKYWKSKYYKGKRVPVFFNKDKSIKHGQKAKIKHFGLAYLYRIMFDKSVHDLVETRREQHEEDCPLDFAETIFGHTLEDNALKGRVAFQHAFSNNAKPITKPVEEILGSPKSSFYPYYLKNGKSYNEAESIAGFKRYPVRQHTSTGQYTKDQLQNKNVFSKVLPLKSGAIFHAKMKFHNLKTVELGAIISAITFHNNHKAENKEKQCFHTIGGLKPFGYGKCAVEDLNVQLRGDQNTIDFIQYLHEFEMYMHKKKKNWGYHKNILELVNMAVSTCNSEIDYSYPKMEVDGDDEFSVMRKNGKKLTPQSELSKPIVDIYIQKDIQDIIDKIEKKKEEERKRKEEEKEQTKKDQLASIEKRFKNITSNIEDKTKDQIKLSDIEECIKRLEDFVNEVKDNPIVSYKSFKDYRKKLNQLKEGYKEQKSAKDKAEKPIGLKGITKYKTGISKINSVYKKTNELNSSQKQEVKEWIEEIEALPKPDRDYLIDKKKGRWDTLLNQWGV